ncbi:subtilase family protein [Mucilaginibacter gracilis]|uniref:Subtilase family protein n=1 Tax=Mucilaginibacter gracilis TaxID=423350 RepID=A0A495IZE9_9SPHI|nr:S8 family serine peptidase [Mucilaginibacter gracilis]RKR82096.1 subtilase family protein [Mucilaginibacter gracilis]
MKQLFKTVLFAIGLLLTKGSYGQHVPNWQNKDLQKDSLFGISTEKAYTLLQGKKARPVIVAVIDAGVDTLHEDLKSILWINPKKKKNDNGTYGWSFIGSAKGNVQYDNLELTRQVRQFEAGDTSRLSINDLTAYHTQKALLTRQLATAKNNLRNYSDYLRVIGELESAIKTNFNLADIKAYPPKNLAEQKVARTLLNVLADNDDLAAFKKQLSEGITRFEAEIDYQLNTAYDPRPLYVGDDYFNSKQVIYGSPDCMGPDAHHGTHVAGIIAGLRGNGLGADGIADNVRVLAVRAVPDGDERDKDIANAIRYAADHGAKVINMSFGKDYNQDKTAVDDAVKYAIKKDVLLIQAAGNDDKNIDSSAHFPNPSYLSGGKAAAYIVVGASGLKGEKAGFSNYGKNEVDVFAPGVQIYSSIPGSKYDYFNGTSMAAPVVAGLAALIREYYPKLSAIQVKNIILKSVIKSEALTNYCATGGIVNAYNALQMAAGL